MTKINIGFIGFGKMATAIYEGITTKEISKNIIFTRKNKQKSIETEKKYTIQYHPLESLIETSSIIIIAVKPNQIIPILKKLQKTPLKNKLIISILAGTPIKIFEQYLPQTAIARIMPNIAATINESMSALCWNKYTTTPQQKHVLKIVNSIGKSILIQESDFHFITALCGSNPAFIYTILKELLNFKNHHLTKTEVTKCIAQVLIGSGKLLLQEKLTIKELISNITSPNGTTAAGLKELEKNKIEKKFEKVIQKTIEKSQTMEKEIKS